MVCSMTGYGRVVLAAAGRTVTAEIRSVNHKHLDLRLEISDGYGVCEAGIRELVRRRIRRGSVSMRVKVLEPALGGTARRWRADDNQLAVGIRELRRLAARHGLRDDLSLSALLAAREFWMPAEPAAAQPAVERLILRTARGAVDQLLRMRRIEGAVLGDDIRSRLRGLRAAWRRIRAKAPDMRRCYQEALVRRLREAGLAAALRDDRLRREILVFAERSDISEELTRLDSHLKQVAAGLRSSQAVGRKLDFLVQELFREIGTVAAKANDRLITEQTIVFKTELEKVREQVQNLE